MGHSPNATLRLDTSDGYRRSAVGNDALPGHALALIPAPVYDAEAVDRYTEQLWSRISDLEERLSDADRRAAEAHDAENALATAEVLFGRVLLRAQDEADRRVALADDQARRLIMDTERRVEAMLAGAQANAVAIMRSAHANAYSAGTPPEVDAQSGPRTEQGEAPARPYGGDQGPSPAPRTSTFDRVDRGAQRSYEAALRLAIGLEATDPVAPTEALPRTRADTLADLRERWRVSRFGPEALEDEALRPRGPVDAMMDDDYLTDLRAAVDDDNPSPIRPRTDQHWHPGASAVARPDFTSTEFGRRRRRRRSLD